MKFLICVVTVVVALMVAVDSQMDEYKFCYRYDKDCEGRDIGHVQNVSQSLCERACLFHPDCNSIQYFQNSDCYLKNHACTFIQLRNFTGGVDAILVKGWDRCQHYLKGDVLVRPAPRQ